MLEDEKPYDPSDIQETSLRDNAYRNKLKKQTQRVRFDGEEEGLEGANLSEETLLRENLLEKTVSFYIQDEMEMDVLSDPSVAKEPDSLAPLPRCMSENLHEERLMSNPASPVLDSQDTSQPLDMSPHSLNDPQQADIPTIHLFNLPKTTSSGSSFLHPNVHATFSDIPSAFDPETCLSSSHPPSRQEDEPYEGKSGRKHGKEFYCLMKDTYDLVRSHLRSGMHWQKKILKEDSELSNSMNGPSEDTSTPPNVRGGVLSHLLKLWPLSQSTTISLENQMLILPHQLNSSCPPLFEEFEGLK
ncbi:hypothetical protein PCK1_000216 [Pneumocystis canis]|nr:hypothetical protein PCK1_000216 [Pneumocystis canis]